MFSIVDDSVCSGICLLSPNKGVLILVKVVSQVKHSAEVIQCVVCLSFMQFPLVFEQAVVTWHSLGQRGWQKQADVVGLHFSGNVIW